MFRHAVTVLVTLFFVLVVGVVAGRMTAPAPTEYSIPENCWHEGTRIYCD